LGAMADRSALADRHSSLRAVTEAVLALEGVQDYLRSIGKEV